MKKWIALCLAALLIASPSAFAEQAPDSFTVEIVCESDDIYQLYYACYQGDNCQGLGGVADPGGQALAPDSPLTVTFPASCFDDPAHLENFGISFSLYGEDDLTAIAATDRLTFPAEFGGRYTVVLSGDRDSGLQAALAE